MFIAFSDDVSHHRLRVSQQYDQCTLEDKADVQQNDLDRIICEQRWISIEQPAILSTLYNIGQPRVVGTVARVEAYRVGWASLGQAPPQIIQGAT